VDRNERILSQVLRERTRHRGVTAVRSGWFFVGVVVVVIALTVVGFQLAQKQRAGPESSGVDGAEVPESSVGPSQAMSRATAVEPPSKAQSAGSRNARYIVQPGDTLQLIAVRNGLDPATLVSVNELEDPDTLQPGRELIIPRSDGVLHIVESGETLRSIADRYGIQTTALIDANGISAPDDISVGMRLFIPRAWASAVATAGH
jgi:LysM repeat protein